MSDPDLRIVEKGVATRPSVVPPVWVHTRVSPWLSRWARPAGTAAAALFRLIPAVHRFALVRQLANSLGPVLRRTAQFSQRRGGGLETPHESGVYLLLYALGLAGVPVPVPLRVPDLAVLDAALARGGVLLVVPHVGLVGQLVIWLGARGYRPTIVTANPRRPRPGTGKILLGPSFMLRVRTALRGGGLVLAMIDHPASSDRRIRRVATPGGDMFVSDGLVRLAMRCGATTLFGSAALDGPDVRVMLGHPSPEAVSADATLDEFCAFVAAGASRAAAATAT